MPSESLPRLLFAIGLLSSPPGLEVDRQQSVVRSAAVCLKEAEKRQWNFLMQWPLGVSQGPFLSRSPFPSSIHEAQF